MKAARIREPGSAITVDEVSIPDVRSGEVLLQMRRAGLNRGDLHMREGDFDLTPGQAADLLPELPMTIGHDGLGEVVEVGPDVGDVAVGDMAVTKCTLTCGFCRYCRSGRERLCVHHRVMGFFTLSTERGSEEQDIFSRYKDGTMAEYCRLPATNVEVLKPDDDVDEMCKVSQIAVGYRGLKVAPLGPGETVIVNAGSGITGIGTVLAALVMGAAHVIVVARNQARLDHVESIDPARISTISLLEESIRERVDELTEGQGANVLADLTPQGVETTIECMESLEPGGRIVLLGGNTELLEVGYRFLFAQNFEITASAGRFYTDFPELFELTRRGAIDVSPIHTEYFPLEEADAAVDFLGSYDGDVTKWPMIKMD